MATLQEVNEYVTNDLGELLDAGDCDMVTLVAGETRLRAHRAVLSDRSPVFGAMLHHDMLEASRGEVDIPDVEGPVLREVLKYCYTLQAPQRPSMAPQLLAAADKYDLPALKAACEEQLVAQLSVETAAAFAALAVRHSCGHLRQAAIRFIKDNLVQVMATQGWEEGIRYQPEEFIEINRLVVAPVPETRSLPTEDKGRRLIAAAKEGAVEEVAALLAAGANVGARDGDSNTALHYAARRRNVDVARRLLLSGAEVDARSSRQRTPLHEAAVRGHVAVARLLLVAGADVNASEHRRYTPLHVAALAGHSAVVRLLAAAGADLNARTDGELTPLHCAALEGHAEAAAALLEAGADRGARNNKGNTPLTVATNQNHTALVDLLTQS